MILFHFDGYLDIIFSTGFFLRDFEKHFEDSFSCESKTAKISARDDFVSFRWLSLKSFLFWSHIANMILTNNH